MTAAERERILALADEWETDADNAEYRDDADNFGYYFAEKLRALVAEMEDGDGK